MSNPKKKPSRVRTSTELQSKSLAKGINMNMRVFSTVQASVPVSGEAFALTKAAKSWLEQPHAKEAAQ